MISPPASEELPLRKHFAATGATVELVSEVDQSISCVRDLDPDLILIASAFPLPVVLQIASQLRASLFSSPLLHLLASESYSDRVQSLRAGADDVLSCPFAIDELDARIFSLLRRSSMGRHHVDGDTISFHGLQLDTNLREVIRDGDSAKLTVKEYNLLAHFLRHPDEVLSRKSILHSVWGQTWKGDDNLLDVYIRNLRRKIEREHLPALLQTVKGVGYVLRSPTGD